MFFSETSPSLNAYLKEVSGGRASARGDVFGWYTLDRDYSCNEADAMLNAAIEKADLDTDLTSFNRIFLVFPQPANCGWAGLGTVNCNQLNSKRYGPFSASVAWMIVNGGWGLAAQR